MSKHRQTRAVGYCRISRDVQHDELGVKRQETECLALCEREGLDVVALHVDDDRSAYTGKPRPGYMLVMELIESGSVDTLVAWHPDRLVRHPRELEDLIDALEANDTRVRTVQAGEYDLATPSGRMTARVVGAVARHESEHKAARLRSKHVELAEAGAVSGGGTRPFGFEQDRVTVRTSEAVVIRELVAALLGGATIRSLCMRLEADGVSTATGRPWHPHVLATMLASSRIAGLRSHRGVVVAEAVWPAIITPEQHRKVVAILSDPDRRKNREARRYLLTGLLMCSLCDARLVARPRGDKRKCYVCATGPGFNGCGKLRTLSDPIDELVVEAVLHRLAGDGLASVLAESGGDDAVVAKLDEIDQRLAELGAMWAAGDVDADGWKAASKALRSQRAELAATIRTGVGDRSVSALLGAGNLRERWPQLELTQQRAVLAAVIEAVVLAPALRGRNFFDPDRVSVRWRA